MMSRGNNVKAVFYLCGLACVGLKPTTPDKPAQVIRKRVTQKGAQFYPHVLPIVVGTTLGIVNLPKL